MGAILGSSRGRGAVSAEAGNALGFAVIGVSPSELFREFK